MARIAVVLGSTRQGRFGDKPAAWVAKHLSARDDVDVDFVDLREHPLPVFDGLPPAYTLRNYPTEDVARLGRRIDAADGFVLLTPEYNHGYSAALKNAMTTPSSSGGANQSRSSAGATWGAPGPSNNFDWSPSSSRWHRCVTQCTSCPI